jgi:transcriptional regulator with XRE-family HTH domain
MLLGIDEMTVSRIERGLSNFAIGTLEHLAKTLGVSVSGSVVWAEVSSASSVASATQSPSP